MDRRGFLLGVATLAVAGCARVSPVAPAPTPSAATGALLTIGTDGTPSGGLLAELFSQALAASGRRARVATAGADWQAALADGSLAAFPAYAVTLWGELAETDEPPAGPEALLSEVATLLAPEVATLPAPGVDGGLVWLVTGSTAAAGVASLDRISAWSKGKVAAIPPIAESRADGVPGLRSVYRGAFTVTTVADPAQRAADLASGKVALAGFRGTDYTGVPNLVALEDPDELALADPLVLLLPATLGEADPDAVLAMNRVAEFVTTDMLVDLQAEVAGGAAAPDVARRWLAANGLT